MPRYVSWKIAMSSKNRKLQTVNWMRHRIQVWIPCGMIAGIARECTKCVLVRVPVLWSKSWINLFILLLNDLIFIIMFVKKLKPYVNWALTKYRKPLSTANSGTISWTPCSKMLHFFPGKTWELVFEFCGHQSSSTKELPWLFTLDAWQIAFEWTSTKPRKELLFFVFSLHFDVLSAIAVVQWT